MAVVNETARFRLHAPRCAGRSLTPAKITSICTNPRLRKRMAESLHDSLVAFDLQHVV
jgi:hypothetical protein